MKGGSTNLPSVFRQSCAPWACVKRGPSPSLPSAAVSRLFAIPFCHRALRSLLVSRCWLLCGSNAAPADGCLNCKEGAFCFIVVKQLSLFPLLSRSLSIVVDIPRRRSARGPGNNTLLSNPTLFLSVSAVYPRQTLKPSRSSSLEATKASSPQGICCQRHGGCCCRRR